nr:DUF1214 domain-containing protein [Rhabdothermincola salaria]
MRDKAAERPRNTFGPTFGLAKGLDAARYGFCFWELGPDDALLVEIEAPVARYWSFQLYEMTWFELIDITERQSSLNHAQVAVDGDGHVRLVVSHTDPGVANWLDAGGRAGGLLSLRCFWATSAPDAHATVMPVAEVVDHLPPGTATVDAATRAETMRARRRHLAWRFRT